MSNADFYYMEKDGAVKIPDKYKKMSYEEISAECARLLKTKKTKSAVKKPKVKGETTFII